MINSFIIRGSRVKNSIVKTLLVFLLITPFSFADLGINQLREIDDSLKTAYEDYYFSVFDHLKKSQENPKFYFESYERTQIIRDTKIFLSNFNEINSLLTKKRVTQINKKNVDSIALRAIKYHWLSKFVDLTFDGGNGFVAVLSEDSINLEYNSARYRNIVKDLISQSKRDSEVSTEPHNIQRDVKDKNMVYFYDNFLKIRKLGIDQAIENHIFVSIAEYASSSDNLLKKMKDIDYKAGSYSVFYFIKVGLLKAASYIALPGNHKISLKALKKVDHLAQPGDIGIIQRYYKLSNLVFKGNWTHSLLYLGEYSKFERYFQSDAKTNSFYALKCFERELNCSDYISYLNLFFKKSMDMYKEGEHQKDPIVTIESLKPGVILFNMKKSMGWDNLALLRPTKLSILDKAQAIERAFESIGKPYDYNFNGHTQERFVCTELVSFAYESDPRTNKKGLSWEMNFVMEKPVMYAFDILETYFKRKNTNKQELEVVYYLKGEKGEFGKSRFGNEQELLESVDISD